MYLPGTIRYHFCPFLVFRSVVPRGPGNINLAPSHPELAMFVRSGWLGIRVSLYHYIIGPQHQNEHVVGIGAAGESQLA